MAVKAVATCDVCGAIYDESSLGSAYKREFGENGEQTMIDLCKDCNAACNKALDGRKS